MNKPSYLLFKQCSKCGEILHVSKFHKQKDCKYGVCKVCKECKSKYKKKWREDNRDEILEYQKIYNKEHYHRNKEYYQEKNKKYRKENREELNKKKRQYRKDNPEKDKEYRKNNKDKIKERSKKYYNEHKEKIKEYRDEHKEYMKEYNKIYYNEHRDELLEYQKIYKINNPEKSFNQRSNRRSKENNQGSGISKEQWFEMMEFFQWRCAYSNEYIGGDNKDKSRTIDHIVPLTKNGEHEIWNCVPMVKSYNSSKNTKNMLEWYLEQEYFDIDRLTKIYEWRIYAYWRWKE